MLFVDRIDAGRRLSDRLHHLAGAVVIGLPSGGVPVAFEVAISLGAPLEVIGVRELGVPYETELAMGAVAEDGAIHIDERVKRLAAVSDAELARVVADESEELGRQIRRIRSERPRPPLRGRAVVVVDDGVDTGYTLAAACQFVRSAGAERVVVAVPVAPPEWPRRAEGHADEVVCLETPTDFTAKGDYYADFTPTTEEEVLAFLARREPTTTHAPSSTVGNPAPVTSFDGTVEVAADSVDLAGHLTIPTGATGIVVFAHGSGSSRLSPRNRHVAGELNEAGLATLLFDLLTAREERNRRNVFDIALLGRRLADAVRWVASQPLAEGVPIGLFGASTGAAAALWAAAESSLPISAVVSRGGRPDLAGDRLGEVTAPTRLIVGGRDPTVMLLNREAQSQLRCENDLIVVPGATHLFEEPGTLQWVAESARDWFLRHLRSKRPRSGSERMSSFDPALARARDDAELPDPDTSGAVLLAAREEAEGVEVFEDPDRVVPPAVAKEGAPGHESLSAEQAGVPGGDDEEVIRDGVLPG